jgi:hypothetical protein
MAMAYRDRTFKFELQSIDSDKSIFLLQLQYKYIQSTKAGKGQSI